MFLRRKEYNYIISEIINRQDISKTKLFLKYKPKDFDGIDYENRKHASNRVPHCYATSPILVAMRTTNLKMVELLCQNVKIDKRLKNGMFHLHYAAKNENLEIFQLVYSLAKNKRPLKISEKGDKITPFDIMTEKFREEVFTKMNISLDKSSRISRKRKR